MEKEQFDVAVIGSGPGGYVAAIRAVQLGLKCVCIEKEKTLGGTCLNVGCIPSKALLQATEYYELLHKDAGQFGLVASEVKADFNVMQQRKSDIVKGIVQSVAGLVKRQGVTVRYGTAQFISPHEIKVSGDEEGIISASAFILATGSQPIALPFLPFDEQKVVSSTGALNFPSVPKKLLLIGAGVIGVELASVYQRLGSEVTIFEMLPQICPGMDGTIRKMLAQILKKQGLNFQMSAKVLGGSKSSEGITLKVEINGKAEIINGDAVLVAVGRRPYTEGLNLQSIGISLNPRGFVPVDGNFRTAQNHILAIGDLIEGPMLAHRASGEGIAAVEIIAGKETHVNYATIPSVIYTHPEAAGVGLTEEDAVSAGFKVVTGISYFRGNARARCLGYSEGMVKVIANEDGHRLLGMHIVGPFASEMIGEGAMAISRRASLEDIIHTSHAHPTLTETILDSCLAALG